MNPMITLKNVRLSLKQQFNINEKDLFDIVKVAPELRPNIIKHLFAEFSDCHLKEGKLYAFDSFHREKKEIGSIDIEAIDSISKVMEQLVGVHTQRMALLEKSREKLSNFQYRIEQVEKTKKQKTKERER